MIALYHMRVCGYHQCLPLTCQARIGLFAELAPVCPPCRRASGRGVKERPGYRSP
jgi:hypothetical protein